MINIDTGDSVFHKPSREWWEVAFTKEGWLCACGWPLGFVDVGTCLLVTKATPEERFNLLHRLAAMTGDDPRKRYAQFRLADEYGEKL